MSSVTGFLKQNAGATAILLAALAVFFLAYNYYLENAPERENIVNGVRIFSKGGVKNSLAGLLAPRVLPMQVVFANSSDDRPCKIPMQTELIYALAQSRREVSLQLRVAGEEVCETRFLNKTEKTACTRPRIVIEEGECNCLRLEEENELVRVQASEEWMCVNAVNVREVVRWALS